MSRRHVYLTRIMLWTSGLLCLALPLLWWPRAIQPRSVAVAIASVALLGFVIWSGEKKRLLDPERGPIHGFLGVLGYTLVIFGAVFVYRAVLL